MAGASHNLWRGRCQLVCAVLLGLGLSACHLSAAKPADYLDRASGHATQGEVRQEFGPPLMEVPGDEGGTIWIYRYAGVATAGSATVKELWCYEHALRFGRDRVLQSWKRQNCHD